MEECLGDREFEDGIPEELEAFIGLSISALCFIEYTSVNTGERIELSIFWENLERREERSYLRFKLFTIIAKRSTGHRGKGYKILKSVVEFLAVIS